MVSPPYNLDKTDFGDRKSGVLGEWGLGDRTAIATSVGANCLVGGEAGTELGTIDVHIGMNTSLISCSDTQAKNVTLYRKSA